MSVSTAAYKGAEQPVKGIALICLAVLLFASHDTLSKYLSGFYPIVMVVWARYVVHTLLMLVVFVPRSVSPPWCVPSGQACNCCAPCA